MEMYSDNNHDNNHELVCQEEIETEEETTIDREHVSEKNEVDDLLSPPEIYEEKPSNTPAGRSKVDVFYRDGQNLDNCYVANSAKRVIFLFDNNLNWNNTYISRLSVI